MAIKELVDWSSSATKFRTVEFGLAYRSDRMFIAADGASYSLVSGHPLNSILDPDAFSYRNVQAMRAIQRRVFPPQN